MGGRNVTKERFSLTSTRLHQWSYNFFFPLKYEIFLCGVVIVISVDRRVSKEYQVRKGNKKNFKLRQKKNERIAKKLFFGANLVQKNSLEFESKQNFFFILFFQVYLCIFSWEKSEKLQKSKNFCENKKKIKVKKFFWISKKQLEKKIKKKNFFLKENFHCKSRK